MRDDLFKSIVAVLCLGACVVGCETKAQSGALIGGAGGAGAGAIIGHQSGHGAQGALIGGAVGAIGGALVGNEMDKKDDREARRRDRERYDATREYDRRHSAYDSYGHTITKRDVIEWSARGTRDDIIIDRIERSGTVFNLTRRDENELRDEGVSRAVINAMHDTSRRR